VREFLMTIAVAFMGSIIPRFPGASIILTTGF
jgi:hypothetical protein